MSERRLYGGSNADIVALARRMREIPEVWAVFERIGFHDYMTAEESTTLAAHLRRCNELITKDRDFKYIESGDAMLSYGLLARLGEGLWTDADLDGLTVDHFLSDRRCYLETGERNPDTIPRSFGSPIGKPIELGWVVALAREVEARPDMWRYFSGLSGRQHSDVRGRARSKHGDPIMIFCWLFTARYCLWNRIRISGRIFSLLYGKLRALETDKARAMFGEHWASQKSIRDITDVDAVRMFFADSRDVNLDVYFEDLDR